MSTSHCIGAALLTVALSGCGEPSAVMLVGSIGGVSVQVDQLTLGTRLAGEFVLTLSLGPVAPEPVTVTIESISLARASDGTSLISPLPAVAPDVTPPISVAVGENRPVTFVLDDMDLRPPEDIDAVCAEPVQIIATIRDTLSDAPAAVRSPSVDVSGCP